MTVNGEQTERDNGTAAFTPWSYSLPSGAATAHFQNADILAVAQNAVGEDVEQHESGSVFVPAEETLLAYDEDGNMTFDGRFRYSWNGENRMIRAEEAVAPTNRASTVIAYAYDEQGRMVSKNIAGTNSVARSLIWDGYNIVRETDNGILTYNVWGLDLDGTLQGCGGVGGLLAVAKPNSLHVALYDANGNISEYVSNNGFKTSHYEYSPFGENMVSNGSTFSHTFSAKASSADTCMIAYQFRIINSRIGRWMSRDTVEEFGGRNLFNGCNNSFINHYDYLGMWKEVPETRGTNRLVFEKETGDTIEKLARIVDLDASESAGWGKVGLEMQSSITGSPLTEESMKGACYVSVPNVWIAADLLRGGYANRVINIGGSFGRGIGTGIFVSSQHKIILPDTVNELIDALNNNAGDIWGLSVYAHGSMDGMLAMPALPPSEIDGKRNEKFYSLDGTKWMNQAKIIKGLRASNYRIAHAHMMQCYSAYIGTVEYADERTGGKKLVSYNWDAEWKSVAICFSGYYGTNIAGLDDHGWLIFPWNWF